MTKKYEYVDFVPSDHNAPLDIKTLNVLGAEGYRLAGPQFFSDGDGVGIGVRTKTQWIFVREVEEDA